MIGVRQTIFDLTDGNCLAACFASILELPLEQVPQCIRADDWWEQYRAWANTLGFELVSFIADWAPQGLAVAGGRSRRGNLHACVFQNGELVWDPAPGEGGLQQVTQWMVFLPLDPARLPRVTPPGAHPTHNHLALASAGEWDFYRKAPMEEQLNPQFVVATLTALHDQLDRLRRVRASAPPCPAERALVLSITRLEESIMWLSKVGSADYPVTRLEP